MTLGKTRVRIGILWRGDRNASPGRPEPSRGMDPLFAAFDRLPVDLVPVLFEDNAIEDVRKELFELDGILVWVNPIQDGVTRANLDSLLREMSAIGIYVSADPRIISKLGTKAVLFETRHLGWGSDSALYANAEEFHERFPSRLSDRECLVLKQGRGNGGNGVWKIDMVKPGNAGPDTPVWVQDARTRNGSPEEMTLATFMARAEACFSWSGFLVDQEYQERLAEGMIRCYFCHDRVVGFCHQWPQGLLDMTSSAVTKESPASTRMEGSDVARYQGLRFQAESEWVPQMMSEFGINREELPVIWDADFLYGPKVAGEDTYVLCEVNVSAVWPFPPMGAEKIAAAAFARTTEAIQRRS